MDADQGAGADRGARPLPVRPGTGRRLTPAPPTPTPDAVELRGFGWRHAGRRAWAVRGVDLRIERGERVLLLGASGAGKSTLLAALAGLLADDSGEREGTVTVAGLDPRYARDRVGIVFQDPQTQLVMARAGDDVAFGLENQGVPAVEIWPRVDTVLATVGFRYGRGRRTHALSGGEQQRLALAGALVRAPALLLLDEPTANLDPDGAALVRSALARVPRDTTMMLIEHRVELALPLVDRVVVLSPGAGVAADGPPAAVFARHGDLLAAGGVWVPGRQVLPRRAAGPPGGQLLQASDLGYRHPGADRPSLSDVDMEVRENEVLAVVGPNGSGKSTLALLLGGLLRPSTGWVRAGAALADDRPAPHRRPADQRAPDRRPADQRAPDRWPAAVLAGRIGSVFQEPEHQFLASRVDDELAIGPRRIGHPTAAVRSIVDELLQRLRLTHLAAANPYTLSGGEQRRLSVATALATAPWLLVLDEPTFGQDRRTWLELVELLAKVRDDGRGVVAVTHDAAFVDGLADRVLHLPGAVHAAG